MRVVAARSDTHTMAQWQTTKHQPVVVVDETKEGKMTRRDEVMGNEAVGERERDGDGRWVMVMSRKF